MKDQSPVTIERELLAQMITFIQAYGAIDSPSDTNEGNCVSCGVNARGGEAHFDFCEWAQIVDHPTFRALAKEISHD